MRCSSMLASRVVLTLPVLITLLPAGCSSLLSPVELFGLAEGERRWAARPFADYSFEMRESCFCPYYGWVRATVVANVVVALESLEPDEAPLPDTGSWPTIEKLFAQIRRLSQHEEGPYRELDVRFDAALGYPTWVAAKADEQVMDAGFTIEVRAVHGLE